MRKKKSFNKQRFIFVKYKKYGKKKFDENYFNYKSEGWGWKNNHCN